MAKDPIIFALANPVSEISKPDALEAGAALYADGRIMNNALAYPGIFRGLLDMQATMVTVEMVTAAAKALARQARPQQPDARNDGPRNAHRRRGGGQGCGGRQAGHARAVANAE